MGGLISKRILIANGYHHDIYARVDTDKSAAIKSGATHIRLPSADDKNATVNESITNELFKEKLFIKMAAGFRACFRINTSAKNSNADGEVYVTIALSNGEFICRGLAVQVNRCLIIDSQGNLQIVQHSIASQLGVGTKSSATWKDIIIDGIDHGKLKKNV
ncbi:uncharacterized protein LOC130687924 [Daphnia carinata]|uniref:uncharacterized protein LOC130687924 n=1 Tax=Daphnia carinata TaxID=120202 RepID=UPI00257E5905|nr:uncharacterized protein LOC130687924 [Daphnia carinata]